MKLILSLFFCALVSCTVHPNKDEFSNIRFMFDANEIKNFDYPFEDYSKEIINLLVRYPESEKNELIGVSRFKLGHHPTMYVLYFEDQAIVNFFYWGKNVGKGYIRYDQGAPHKMASEFKKRGLCTAFQNKEGSIWGFHLSKDKNGKWLICNEPFNVPALGSEVELDVSETPFIGKYFDENFGNKIVWNHYSYGE